MNESINAILQTRKRKWAYNRHDRLKLVFLNYYIFTISEIKDISRIISNLKKIIALAIECICIVISRILIAIVTGRFRLSVNRLFYYYDKKDDAFVDVVYYKHARKHACTHTAWASSGWYPVLRVACVRAYARALYYIFFFSHFLRRLYFVRFPIPMRQLKFPYFFQRASVFFAIKFISVLEEPGNIIFNRYSLFLYFE